MGIRDEVYVKKYRQKRRWRLTLTVLAIGGVVAFMLFKPEPEIQEYITTTVQSGDLIIGIEGEGRVKGNDTMTLSFPIVDKLIAIYVKP